MNGEAIEGVFSPDEPSPEWKTILDRGNGPRFEGPYVLGKVRWSVRIISLRQLACFSPFDMIACHGFFLNYASICFLYLCTSKICYMPSCCIGQLSLG
jgi:hypothetical protein